MPEKVGTSYIQKKKKRRKRKEKKKTKHHEENYEVKKRENKREKEENSPLCPSKAWKGGQEPHSSSSESSSSWHDEFEKRKTPLKRALEPKNSKNPNSHLEEKRDKEPMKLSPKASHLFIGL